MPNMKHLHSLILSPLLDYDELLCLTIIYKQAYMSQSMCYLCVHNLMVLLILLCIIPCLYIAVNLQRIECLQPDQKQQCYQYYIRNKLESHVRRYETFDSHVMLRPLWVPNLLSPTFITIVDIKNWVFQCEMGM